MDLMDTLRLECCSVELRGRQRDDVLRELAELACNHPAAAALGADTIYTKLRDRELQGSTGLGNGVAIPHARIAGLSDFVIGIGVRRHGIDFGAIDGKKSRLFFFIIGPPEANTEHLKALAAISRQTSSARLCAEMLRAPSATALYEAFIRRLSATSIAAPAVREMKLMFLVLYMEELIYDILQILIEEGIDGANILDSSGMGKYISSVPLFAEFIGFMQTRKEHSQTVMALIPADREQRIVEKIESLTGDLDENQGAFIVTFPAHFHKGSMRMM